MSETADRLVYEDPFAAEVALRAPPGLREFNRAGVLSAADVHVAVQLGRLGGVQDEKVLLAVALAVRGPRMGHVFVDLAAVSQTAAVETDESVDLAALPWPDPAGWVAAVARCADLVAVGEADEGVFPVRLVGSRLYLDRYWREERQLAVALRGLSGAALKAVELDRLAAGLARLFPDAADPLQRAAAACAVLRGLTVIAGGPGTGKTTTVARAAALIFEEAAVSGVAGSVPLIALCAPTGKAAVRLEEAVHGEAVGLPVSDGVREQLLALRASTIHRLLGWRPGSHSRFRHDAANRLPYDVVIVDETSMVPLSLMGRLLEAVRPEARVVLVGDPDQLTAIEAGAVLRDIVGPAAGGMRMSDGMRALLGRVAGAEIRDAGGRGSFGDGVVVLERGHRFGPAIGAVAAAIRRGDADGVLEAAARAPGEVTWLAVDVGAELAGPAGPDLESRLEPLRAWTVQAGAAVIEAAGRGDGTGALRGLGAFRLLCAHRRGPYGVATWTAQIERWLADAVDGFEASERNYVGRPLLITENDYELRLYNGDIGAIIRTGPQQVGAVFERDGSLVTFAPSRLEAAQTLYAMTIHKSQGSQFDVAAVLLPEPESRILSRELLYTAVTRARGRLILIGSEAAVRAAVGRPVARASGLRERLWGASGAPDAGGTAIP